MDEFYFLSCSCPFEVIPSMSLDKNTAFALQAVSSCCRGPGGSAHAPLDTTSCFIKL